MGSPWVVSWCQQRMSSDIPFFLRRLLLFSFLLFSFHIPHGIQWDGALIDGTVQERFRVNDETVAVGRNNDKVMVYFFGIIN